MKFITMLLLTILLTSCAHHHKEPDHHHHAYDKQCAYSVAHGDVDVKGSDEFKMDHGGKTYFFSTEEKMKDFKSKLNENINIADKHWSSKR